MFIWTEAGYQLFRNKGRSILLLCASLLLCGCIAFYLGNISANRQALETLSESTPAIVRVSNKNADTFDNMTISYTYADGLMNRGLSKVFATAQAQGYYTQESKEALRIAEEAREREKQHPSDPRNGYTYMRLPDGDTGILGVSCLEVIGERVDDMFTFAGGYDSSFLEGDEPLCLVSEEYAARFGFALGDKFSADMCFVQYNAYRMPVHTRVSSPTWTIVGIYSADLKTEHMADAYVPVNWLRKELAEKAPQMPFTYTSFWGYLEDSMNLNAFKESINDMGLGQPFFLPGNVDGSRDLSAAKTLYMDDEDFIRTAEKLGQSIRQYEAFLIPFFVVVVFLVTLAIFLVLRGSRRDMAIACSLGRPKVLTGAATLLAALGAQLAGALLSVPVTVLFTGMGAGTALMVCGAFMLCALAGDVVGLLALLRFDALALLTATD